MALETGTYISDLVSSNPVGTDTLDKADDHLRLIKSTVQATFPNITGAVTPTHTELNYVDGVTSAIQTQLDAKSPLASPTFTGTPAAPTAAVDTNTTQIATTAYVVGQGYAKLASPTFTGVVATQAGSAALPALIPTGDTDTGLWFPAANTIAASTAGSERIRIDSSGNVGIGAAPTALFKLAASDANCIIGSFGTGGYGSFYARGSGTNPGYLFMANVTNGEQGRIGTADTGIMSFYNTPSAIERLRIDASGNILNVSSGGLGYGTGSGGAVTQATSRTTAVTLNKLTGVITLFTAAGSATPAQFTVNNNLIGANDTVLLTVVTGTNVYVAKPYNIAAGVGFGVNFWASTGTASDTPKINFTIIKGANA